MVYAIGEILLDVFPSCTRLGGAPFNYALNLKRLGVPVRFISRIGNDEEGRLLLDKLRQYRFSAEDIQIDQVRPTGKVLVEVDKAGTPSFMIVEDTAYDYIEIHDSLARELAGGAEIIYYGTLIQRSRIGYDSLRRVMKSRGPDTLCLYDINLRKGCFNEKIIMESISFCNILKLNSDELKVLKLISGTKTGNDQFIRSLMKEYSITMTALTLGARGSILYADGKKIRVKPASAGDIVDTVGAGDAYAAALTLGILNKIAPEMIARGASALAWEVCRCRGAIPENDNVYEGIKRMMANPASG